MIESKSVYMNDICVDFIEVCADNDSINTGGLVYD